MSQYLTALASVLRDAGCQVVELAGWEGRGRSGNSQYADGKPWCVMVHHTASAGDGWADAEYCTYRSPDAPVTNLVIGRDGVVYVCAAGPTNTNGKGYAMSFSKGNVPNDSMNTHAVGIELSSNGVGMTYPQPQVDALITACTSICAAYGLDPADVATHNEWAPDRKIDPATAAAVQGPWRPASSTSSGTWNMQDLRNECERRAGTPAPEPPRPIPEDDMSNVLVLEDARNGVWYRCGADSKTWVQDGNMAEQLNMRIAETGQDGVAVDGFRYIKMRNGNVNFITSCGPIVGPRPPGVDEYGR